METLDKLSQDPQARAHARARAAAERMHAVGMRASREEGIQLGEARFLIRMLEHRFGDLSTTQEERVLNASPHTLQYWAARLFDAQSLEDIFSP